MTEKQIEQLKGFVLRPKSFLLFIFMRYISFLIKDDRSYLRILYRLKMGEKLDLEHPKTFQEKLQWLKLYNRRPEYTKMVDKYEAKKYVASIIGEEHIIPTYGVWDNFDEIDFSKLPDKFVLKCTHDSGRVIICKDKTTFDIGYARKRINKALRTNYFLRGREWPYKNVKPRIIAEAFMEEKDQSILLKDFEVYSGNSVKPEMTGNEELTDYKFFCFDGEPFMMYVSHDRAENPTTDFFDMNYQRLPIRMKDPNSEELPEKPAEFDEMKELARKLSEGHPHLRVDFYVINHQIYFGELTFYHNMGFTKVKPEEWNSKLGDMITIRYADGRRGG